MGFCSNGEFFDRGDLMLKEGRKEGKEGGRIGVLQAPYGIP